ncbi:methyltransferase [Penicillium angulare]|uniref:methyltransferase n=1 Tax=Penicillium angulare TaxID=116970 RepID=UPI00253FDB7D|nr:methyltransferase [Penicillium angulare]KAJ5267752.1 methyltransferase [Penicillium angulare]
MPAERMRQTALPEVLKTPAVPAFGMNIYIAYELGDLLRQAGFSNIQKTTFKLGYGAEAREEHWREPSAEMWVDTFRSLGHKLPTGGIPGVAKNASSRALPYGLDKQTNKQFINARRLNRKGNYH